MASSPSSPVRRGRDPTATMLVALVSKQTKMNERNIAISAVKLKIPTFCDAVDDRFGG